MSGKLFGTDGIRGRANKYPMVPEFALKLGQAAGVMLTSKKKRVAICRDTRVSGEMLEAALVAGFTSVGVDVLLLGVLPTPAMIMLSVSYDIDMAVIITASHNPYYDNGIKIVDGEGKRFSDSVMSDLEKKALEGKVELESDKLGRVEHLKGEDAKYLSLVKKVFDNSGNLKGLRVVLDCANGVLSEVLPEIFKQLGAGVITLGNNPDGYNINKESGSQHPKEMMDTVVKSNANLGIAVDGDGDRILVCDEKGKRVDPDQLLAFFAKEMIRREQLKGNAVVSTIVSNLGLEKFVTSLGLDYYATDVGERFILEKMEEIGSNIGGEESGHIVLSDYAKSGDGLVAALFMSQALLKSGKKMSEIFPVFDVVVKKRVDVEFDGFDKISKAMSSEVLKKAMEDCEKELADKGKILVRKSGTEPKIQTWVWCDDDKLRQKASDMLVGAVSEEALKAEEKP